MTIYTVCDGCKRDTDISNIEYFEVWNKKDNKHITDMEFCESCTKYIIKNEYTIDNNFYKAIKLCYMQDENIEYICYIRDKQYFIKKYNSIVRTEGTFKEMSNYLNHTIDLDEIWTKYTY